MAYDVNKFSEIVNLSSGLRNSPALASRNEMFREMEDMFLLNDDLGNILNSRDYIKETYDTEPRDTLLGAVRLMSATEPAIDVTTVSGKLQDDARDSRLELAAGKILDGNAAIKGKPIHYEMNMMSLLYGEIHAVMGLASDMSAINKGTQSRFDRVRGLTPVVVNVLNPAFGYPLFDDLGLAAYHQCTLRSVASLQRLPNADKLLASRKPYETVEFNEFWDDEYHAAWVTGMEPFYCEPHGLSFIPVTCVIAEGSELFSRDNSQPTRQPFLYGAWRSNIWKRSNLALTVMYTLVFSLGANAMYLYKRATPDKQLEVNFDFPFGVVNIDQGEEFASLVKNVIDPSVIEALNMAQQKLEQTTMYKQALGQPLGPEAPFSMVALLNQAGRLPLVPYQKAGQNALSDIIYKSLMLVKEAGDSEDLNILGLEKDDISDQMYIKVGLDIDLPADARQNMVIATQAVMGDNPLTSHRYAREALLNIKQPDLMQNEIWNERFANLMAQAEFSKMAQELLGGQQQSEQPTEGQSWNQVAQMLAQMPPEARNPILNRSSIGGAQGAGVPPAGPLEAIGQPAQTMTEQQQAEQITGTQVPGEQA